MTLTQLLKELNDRSAIQCAVVEMLHVESRTPREVAHTLGIGLERVRFEETVGFKNMVSILMGGDGFPKAAAEHQKKQAAAAAKKEKEAASKAAKAAKGAKLERGAGPPDAA